MSKKLADKIKYGIWGALSIVAGIYLASILFKEEPRIPAVQTAAAIESLKEEETPKYYFIKDSAKGPKVTAGAYLVGDLDTGEVIIAKNEKEVYPIASVSKLMTAYVTSQLFKEGETAVASKKALATYGENGNFHAGEKIKISDLLFPLLLESSNDAAEILAEHFDRDSFLKKMNQVAKSLEMTGTYFQDPSGLSADNRSTVYDMFKLTAYIREKAKVLFDITTKRSYANKVHSWSSNNQFLRQEGYLGGKSGYTDPAKQTVVSSFSLPLAENGNRNIAITLLQSQDRYKDVLSILSYLGKNVYFGGKEDVKLAWVKEKAGIPDIKDPDFVTLLFAGDMMMDRGVESSVMKNFAGDFSMIFEKMDILKKADIVFANLEGPASDEGKDRKNLYSFRMAPTVIPALKGAGISIVSVANNHMGDWGREAYLDTLRNLEENEVMYTGGGMTKVQAEEPKVIEKYGMKVGFLGFSDVGPDWMAATETDTGILLARNPRFAEIVSNASKKVDYLVVSFHWGDEYKTIHNARQEALAHAAIDNGAKLVIGHHPHVSQDFETYNDGFIAYSLGNFIFDQGFSANTMQGTILEMKLWRDGNIDVKKDTVKLSKQFLPTTIVPGKEEKIRFTSQ